MLKGKEDVMEIVLNQLKFYARHGVLPQEKEVGAAYEVDLVLQIADADAGGALWYDRLDGTVNYAEVYDEVRKQMAQSSALLEHVAARTVQALLRRFRLLRTVEVTIRKCVPPISGFTGAGVAVRYQGSRRLMIWDFDGTLADTAGSIVRTMQDAFSVCGLPVPEPAAIRQTIGLPLSESVRQLSQGSDSQVQLLTDTYRRLFKETGDRGICLFPGIADVLRRQYETGCWIGIATSRSHASVAELCESLGIACYMDGIVACEDVSRSKPAPDPVLALCRQLNAPVGQTVVFGDTSFDMAMGRAAGSAHCVGVTWGNHTEAQLREGGADCVVSQADGLIDLFSAGR